MSRAVWIFFMAGRRESGVSSHPRLSSGFATQLKRPRSDCRSFARSSPVRYDGNRAGEGTCLSDERKDSNDKAGPKEPEASSGWQVVDLGRLKNLEGRKYCYSAF
jgi:hypothetical protein